MRYITLSLTLAILLFAFPASAANEVSLTPAVSSGINGAALADTPSTAVIPMDTTAVSFHQLSLDIVVTWGTSITVNIQCYGSPTSTAGDFRPIGVCAAGAASSACIPDKRIFLKADYADGKVSSNWKRGNYKNMKCTLDDPANGTGTAVLKYQRGN